MEKIYSRKRLKISKFKRTTKIKVAFSLMFLGLILFSVQFIISIYPIFEEACKSKAQTIGNDITSNEVSNVMKNYDYNDLVYIERNDTGEITIIKARMVPINKIISEVTSNIKSDINNNNEVSVEISVGKVTGIPILSAIGPKFNMRMETGGGVEANLISEFTESGINQTLHRIYLDISTNINIITPFNIIGDSYKTKVLIAESIIVGRVPESYTISK